MDLNSFEPLRVRKGEQKRIETSYKKSHARSSSNKASQKAKPKLKRKKSLSMKLKNNKCIELQKPPLPHRMPKPTLSNVTKKSLDFLAK